MKRHTIDLVLIKILENGGIRLRKAVCDLVLIIFLILLFLKSHTVLYKARQILKKTYIDVASVAVMSSC